MHRLVKARTPSTQRRVMRGEERDTYLERIAKYVPSEILAAYIFLLGIMAGTSSVNRFWIVLGVSVFCFALTPFYLSRMADRNEPKGLHLVIGTAAFAVWAYAIGGAQGGFIINDFNAYDSIIASVLVVGFSLLSGLFEPVRGSNQ